MGSASAIRLDFAVDDDQLIVTPVRVVPKSQAWFWSPDWQASEREADADREAGRVTNFGSDEEFLTSLGE